jgi:hypothetical protein
MKMLSIMLEKKRNPFGWRKKISTKKCFTLFWSTTSRRINSRVSSGARNLRSHLHVPLSSRLWNARPPDWRIPWKCEQAKAIMLMIQNNLDYAVAQHPHELITYGGNGAVFQNWAQYLLTMKYLSEMTDEQTLTMYSGHPMGLFPSHKEAPRVVVTNGMVTLIILNRMIGKNECLRRITIRTMTASIYVHRTTRNCTWHDHHSAKCVS